MELCATITFIDELVQEYPQFKDSFRLKAGIMKVGDLLK